jgi:gamma-glutamyltranspeptidase/glutathione hydrolase
VFLQQLALLANTGLDRMEHLSADWVHTVVEASKLAFADREAWYGDPDFTDVPLADLLDPDYNAKRAALIGERASLEHLPGSPGGRTPVLPTRWSTPDGQRPAADSVLGLVTGDTCHVDVVDSDGMMIAATPSGAWLQSSPTVPELGFCLSMRGQMFWLEEGLPNTIRPGARPRTTLSPSMALRDGEPYLAFGTPGGDMQDQWPLHFFLNVVHGGLNLQQALDAADFHSLHMASSFYPRTAEPGRVVAERSLGDDVLADLGRRGHDVSAAEPWSLGRTSAVARDGEWFKAGANARGGQGYAVGR